MIIVYHSHRSFTGFSLILLISGILISWICFGQDIHQDDHLSGFVKNKSNLPLAHVMIYIQSGDRIIEYTLSDSAGYYSISLHGVSSDNARLIARLLGYNEVSFPLSEIKRNSERHFNIELTEHIGVLQEVIIRPEGNTIPFNDTTSIVIRFKETEKQTVEDLLKKLPGFIVDDNGNVAYKGKPIKKVFLEGADLTAHNYKRITRSMSTEFVSRIDIIERFVENPLLGGVVNSDDVVLNLEIDSLYKSRPFGTAEIAYGNKNYRNVGGNGFKLSPDYKIHLQMHTNNVGNRYDPDGAVLLRSVHADVFSSASLNSPVLRYSVDAPGNFFANTNINNEHQFGLAGVLQSRNKKLVWNHDVSFLFDRRSQLKWDSLSFQFGAEPEDKFQTLDKYSTNNQLSNIYIRNRFVWRADETNQFDASLHFNHGISRLNSLLDQYILTSGGSVSDEINEMIRSEISQVNLFLEYTKKIRQNQVLLANFNLGYNAYPQKFETKSNFDRFTYPSFPDSTFSTINQSMINVNRSVQSRIRLLNSIHKYTYEIFAETSYSNAGFSTAFSEPPFLNESRLEIEKVFTEIGLSGGFHFRKIKATNTISVRSDIFRSRGAYYYPYWNSKLTFDLSTKSKFDIELVYKRIFPEVHELADFFYFSKFNFLNAGLSAVGFKRATSVTGSYQFEDLRNFWRILLSGGVRHMSPDFISSLNLKPLVTYQRMIALRHTTSTFLETEVTKFIPSARVRLTSALTADQVSFFNFINESDLRINIIQEYNLKVEMGTSLAIPVNFFVTARFSQTHAKTTVQNSGFLLKNSNEITQLRFAMHYKQKISTTKILLQHIWLSGTTVTLLSGSFFVKPLNKSYSFSASAQNLINQKFIYQFIRTDLYYSQFGYNLLPAFFLLGINFSI